MSNDKHGVFHVQGQTPDHERTLTEFLGSIHNSSDGGYIEIRVIEDKKGGDLVDRRWYSTAAELVADLPRLARTAEARNAGIFFGVLLRTETGKGKAEDACPGAVAWADIDFRDFKGGEAEARALLAKLPIPPSIVVRSGHGLHCYWLLREVIDPTEIAALNRRLARALGADHAFDAARVLRLPCTFNRKDPANPLSVEIESMDADKRYNPSEIEYALDILGTTAGAIAGDERSGTDTPVHIADAPSERVDALITGHRRIGNLFLGRGKPSKRLSGEALDDSSSGYDFSLVKALAEAGVTDPNDLATALALRPDGKARAKGLDYIGRTARNALALVLGAPKDADAAADFAVARARIYSSAQPLYEFEIDGKTLTVTSAVLNSRHQFAVRLTDLLQRVPRLPSDKYWAAFINGVLRDAEVVEQPPDAADEAAQLDDLARLIANKTESDAAADLNAGRTFRLPDGRTAFKLTPVLKEMRAEWLDLSRTNLARLLRKAGFVPDQPRLPDGAKERVWTKG